MASNVSSREVGAKQYSLAKILTIWAAAALPMGILGWVVYPALTPDRVADPLGAGVTRTALMTVGLVWQFVLAMFIVYREEGNLHWTTIRRRLWLNAPLDPKTGEPRRRLWLWLIPLVGVFVLGMLVYGQVLNNLWLRIFPFLAPPPGFNPMDLLFASPELQAQLVGAWGFYGLFLILAVFNILGEEFLFRGVLLPKMEGVFGKWDWVANGALFAVYHLHEPWFWLAYLDGIITFALPARRFRSTWLAIIVHSVQIVIFAPMILMAVLGLM
ncbi:MAG TPA: CPBP family glutamic-type intramembrane protease [Anaerolineae bacterium]|nr:CPBP family glutamic-type intramembrane protease [Anaerolineae bacterium]HUW14191.1 CPBP family glutamic-type intramembrane protease [Anaerolineae bacterium]